MKAIDVPLDSKAIPELNSQKALLDDFNAETGSWPEHVRKLKRQNEIESDLQKHQSPKTNQEKGIPHVKFPVSLLREGKAVHRYDGEEISKLERSRGYAWVPYHSV